MNSSYPTLKPIMLLLFMSLLLTEFAASQDSSAALLTLQRSRAALDISSSAKHARGLEGMTYGNPGDVWSYPNSLACLVVYGNGKYVLEKRDEQTVGKPKTKSAEGTLSADELTQLKTILDDEALKKITTPKIPDLPEDTAALREIESLDLQIDRAGATQHFTSMKRRIKTGASNGSMTAGASTGMDTFQDNEAPFKKTLSPLMKWFEGMEKKNKSGLKESKPQYCRPINVGIE
ncbi:MAG: hypothetical protein HY010_03740 [Acidobacteria bacterium]|nr:hypothetical protein [Acidobacteriota bacterium]